LAPVCRFQYKYQKIMDDIRPGSTASCKFNTHKSSSEEKNSFGAGVVWARRF